MSRKSYPAEELHFFKNRNVRAFFDFNFCFLVKWVEFNLKVNKPSRILEVGPGARPWKNYLKNVDSLVWHQIELDPQFTKDVDFHDWAQVKAQSYDLILLTEVLEHCPDPEALLQNQINQALKPGGVLLISVPFAAREHMEPFDYWRWTSFGFRLVVEERLNHIYKLDELQKLGSEGSVLLQKMSFLLYQKLKIGSKVGRLGWSLVLMVYCLLILPLGHLVCRRSSNPSAQDFLILAACLKKHSPSC